MAALATVGVKKARPGSMTVNEITLRSTETLIQNLPMERLVREAAHDLKADLCSQSAIFCDGPEKRVATMPKDIQLARPGNTKGRSITVPSTSCLTASD